jgi:hypothetical protein
VRRRSRRECEVRCIGFSAIAYIVAPGSRPTCCSLGISTECPEGTPTVVRATKGVVRFTGVSVSLNAVSGSSARGMIDPRETHNNPRITIVQRTRFTETLQIASQITRPTPIFQCETSRRKIPSYAFAERTRTVIQYGAGGGTPGGVFWLCRVRQPHISQYPPSASSDATFRPLGP